MAKPATILAIDVGTHALRAGIFVPTANGLESSHIIESPLSLMDLGDGHIEQDPAEFLAGFRKLFDALTPMLTNGPCQVALACQRSSVLMWHKRTGAALSPILSWQDTRAAERVRQLPQQQRDFIQQHTGLPVNAHFGASKLATLIPANRSPSDVIHGPLAAWLVHYLTHNPACDLVNACRTLCVDINGSLPDHWNKELCSIWGINPQTLPKIVPCHYTFGDVQHDGKTLGSLQVVTGDQNAAFIALHSQGTHAKFRNPLVVNLGSGAFILGPTTGGATTTQLLRAPLFASASQIEWLQEGTVNGAGSELTRWRVANSTLSESALFQNLPEWLATLNDDIPLYLPTAAGLGSPFWMSRFKTDGSDFFTLDGTPRTASIAKQAIAVVESIAFLVAANIAAMQGTSKPYDGIIFAGGLSRLTELVERICQLAELTGWVSDDFEATLLGAAIACDRQNNKASIKGRIVAANNTTPLLETRYQRYIALIRKQQA